MKRPFSRFNVLMGIVLAYPEVNKPYLKLKLVKGEGYWYFIYDDPANNQYATHAVYVMYLKDLPYDQWVEEGKEFLKKELELTPYFTNKC